MMNDLMAQAVSSGDYVAIWKMILFLLVFGGWAWVGQWLNSDTLKVHTNRTFWNYIYMGCGAGVLFFWFVVPAPFLVDILLYLVVWITVTVIYILHRNARVPAYNRILTPEHLRYVMSREDKKKEGKERLVFISSHKNELPVPQRDEAEYEGYVTAEEMVLDIWGRRVSRAEAIPMGETYQMRYVIDGVLGAAGERGREEMEAAITYLKAVGDLDIKDRRRPQSSGFTIRTEGGNKTEYRIVTSGSTRGEQLVLERVEEAVTLKLDDLGLNGDQKEQLEKAIQEHSGLILVCGLEGTGMSTTLYSMIRSHDAYMQNIHSLEDKLLLELDNITQHLVENRADAKASSRQLQSVLRTDPDVVMVGFCDSSDMARLGTQAAIDGKKMYYGMTSPSTFHGLQEWLNLVKDTKRVAKTLKAVTAQRLMRKLCPECREAYAPDPGLLKKLNLPADKIKRFFRPPAQVEYDKRGEPILCPHCQGTGYYGRTGVFEVLVITEALQKLIEENAPVNVLRTQCRKDRMLYLQEQGIRKVIDGTTSIKEVLRVTSENQGKKGA